EGADTPELAACGLGAKVAGRGIDGADCCTRWAVRLGTYPDGARDRSGRWTDDHRRAPASVVVGDQSADCARTERTSASPRVASRSGRTRTRDAVRALPS